MGYFSLSDIESRQAVRTDESLMNTSVSLSSGMSCSLLRPSATASVGWPEKQAKAHDEDSMYVTARGAEWLLHSKWVGGAVKASGQNVGVLAG